MKRSMEFKMEDVDKLVPNPFQPREGFDKESISELAASLKSVGEIQPIIVREHKRGYEIIAGERRWRAAKFAGMKEIPILVKDTAEEDVLLESLIENLHRLDLTSIERENAIYALWKTGRWRTKRELARELGKNEDWISENVSAAETRKKERIPAAISTRTIADTIALEKEERKQIIEKVKRGEVPVERVREVVRIVRKAPKPVKKAVLEGKVTPAAAEAIIELPKPKQAEVLKEVKAERFTEAETIARVQEVKVEIERPPPSVREIEAFRELAEEAEAEIKDILSRPEVKERGRWFKNWIAHSAVAGAVGEIFCPICGANWTKFGWFCKKHSPMNVKEAYEKVHDEYQKSIKRK